MVKQTELNSVQANGRKKKSPKTKKAKTKPTKQQQQNTNVFAGKVNTQFAANTRNISLGITASPRNSIIYLNFFSDAKF
jgi:hypothetical protein